MTIAAGTRGDGQALPAGARPPPFVATMACAALLPLAALLAIARTGFGPVAADQAMKALLLYAAVLVTYRAGVHAGRARRVAGASAAGMLPIAPPALAFGALLMPAGPGAAVLALAFAASGAADVWAGQRGLFPAWHGRLRARTTALAVALLVAAFLTAAP